MLVWRKLFFSDTSFGHPQGVAFVLVIALETDNILLVIFISFLDTAFNDFV